MKKCVICGEVLEHEIVLCPVCGAKEEDFIAMDQEEETSKSEKMFRVVIVGNGAAAFHAAKAIRERNQVCSINIYGEEPYLAYNRPMLTKALLLGKPAEKMYIKAESWYQENDIKVHVGQVVDFINVDHKTITLRNQEMITYDKLIVATGATSFVPPIPGSNLENVFAIRSFLDTKQIEDAMDCCKQVVVIGGGVLGLEAAWQFKKQGYHVTILELASKLMVRQLDDMASDLLFALIQEQGMDVEVGVNIEAIAGENKVSGVRLSDGRTIPADLVIMSTGIRANVDLAKRAGIAINRAIVVNERCETSVSDVYACGDCAEYDGINYGIWPEATEMGKVAGSNCIGDSLSYRTVSAAITFHGMNTQLYALGDVGKDASQAYVSVSFHDEKKNTYAKYYFVNDVFVGAVLFGNTKDMKRVNESYRTQATYAQMFPEFAK